MPSFADSYRDVFRTLGYSLRPKDEYGEGELAEAADRLNLRLPRSLREYFLVAGREARFNQLHNRLRTPAKWSINADQLVFMEENQWVVFWGVPATSDLVEDCPVFQGVNKKPIDWRMEHDSCFTFLKLMIHWHGTFGGAMPHTAICDVDHDAALQMLERDWQFVGEGNQMRAYHREGCAICFLKWTSRLKRAQNVTRWRLFAGTVSKTKLDQLKLSFNGEWQS